MYDQFMFGNFSVKRTDGSFNKLPLDQVIEQTISKEQKGAGGIINMQKIKVNGKEVAVRSNRDIFA